MDKKVYIEKNALIAELHYDRNNTGVMFQSQEEHDVHDAKYDFAIDVLESTPAAAVVEVVRCKNCVHYRSTVQGEGYCESADVWRGVRADDCLHIVVSPEHYCSFGEFKEGVKNNV